MAGTNFTAHTYRDAAQEHLNQARFLHYDAKRYFLAHYMAGIAVECILRAYGVLGDDDFTGRHDLKNLALRASFITIARPEKQPDYAALLDEATLRWRSSHRYYTEKQLLSYLNNTGIDQRIRGDRLKHSSQRMYNLAEQIVGVGILKWNNE